MLLAYLDESVSDVALCITALVVPESEALPLARDLDSVVAVAQDTYGHIRDDAELHGYALTGATEDWQSLRTNVPARIDIYDRAVAAIASHGVRIYIRGADLDYHRRRYGARKDPYATVLPWALERVQQDALRHDELALVIADEVAREDRHRHAFRDYRQFGTTGWRAQTLDRIVDTIHFAPSKASRLLQAADLVAYVHTQHGRTHADPRTDAAWARMWDALRPRLWEASIWTP